MREEFSDAQIAEFLRRSYFAVDGLWFVKTEDKRGFDEAMERDVDVWSVMAKIQARKAKKLLGIEVGSLQSLGKAFQLKMAAEGYNFDVETTEGEVKLILRDCPWYEVIKRSNRLHISESVTNRICVMEFGGWAREFSPDISFEMRKRLCIPADNCTECEIAFCRKASSSC